MHEFPGVQVYQKHLSGVTLLDISGYDDVRGNESRVIMTFSDDFTIGSLEELIDVIDEMGAGMMMQMGASGLPGSGRDPSLPG